MGTTIARPVRFRVICDDAPASDGVEFGLQDKSGRLDPGVREADGSLAFEAVAEAVTDAAGRTRLRGPSIQGPPDARFVYLSVRPAGSNDSHWLFRMKVRLPPIDRAGPSAFEVRIRATGGGTVRLPDGGWTAA